MKKFLISTVAAATLVAGFIPVANAVTATEQFDVSVTLTAQCTAATTNTGKILNFGTYTAFGGATTPNPTIDFVFTCTRGLPPPTFVFDTGNDYGVVAGLNYHLTASDVVTTAGTAATPVAGVIGVGTAATRTVTVSGSMASGQAGDATAPVSAARSLTITY